MSRHEQPDWGSIGAEVARNAAEAIAATDAFCRAWWRARPDETTQQAAERGRMEAVAWWVGHSVQPMPSAA